VAPAVVDLKIAFPQKGLILNHFGEALSKTNILEKNYLSAIITALDNETDVRTALINKTADIGFLSDFQVILALGVDFNGVVISNLGSLGRIALMVLTDSPIEKINELKGEKIALTFNSVEHQALLEWLKREAIDVADIQLVNLEGQQKLDDLKNGQISAIVETDPLVESYLRPRPQQICRAIYDSHRYGFVLCSKELWLREPKAILRLITGLKEAALFISTNKPQVNNWIKDYCGIEEDLIWGCSAINLIYQSTRKINDPRLFLSDVSIGNLKNINAFTFAQKLIYKSFIVGNIIIPEIQEEAQKEIDPQKYDPKSVKIK
jgi:ABC-type nitrate/sulfonate/bicarbonate transport system substrate-binding protein